MGIPKTVEQAKAKNAHGQRLKEQVEAAKRAAAAKDSFGSGAEYEQKASTAKAGRWPGAGFDAATGSKRTSS